VKYDAFSPKWWESAFVAQDPGGGPQSKWIFSYDSASDRTVFHINGLGTGGPVITGDSWAALSGHWYFVAITRSGGTYRFYLEGGLAGSQTNTAVIPNVPAALTIGWGEGSNRFDGAIDDLRIYTGALSPAEIQALYSAAVGP